MNTHEYNDRYERIITAWEAPDTESHGEQAVLMDGYRRYVRRDGLICVTLVKTDNTSVADSGLAHEEALLEEVGQFPKASLPSPTERAAPAGALPVEVSDETKGLIRASVSENTEKNYRYWSSQIELWLMGRVLDDGLLAAYITELHQSGKSPATISQAVASVRWLARNNGVEIVGEITVKTLSGIRRAGKDRGRGQVDGLTWSEVERVCAFAEMEGSVAGLRDSALIRLMSDCLLRVSEAVAVNCGDLKDKTLVVKASKTDQEGRGEVLYVTSDTRQAIRRYREMAGIDGGCLFRSVRRGGHIQAGRLSARSARRQITYWAELAGVEGLISGHSLRVGSAVSLAQAGASVVDMQVAGRWKSSEMPAHYAKAQLAERGAIARFKERKR